ncbi:MAG: septum formation initiator family protein [Candidatus Yanofskybacteria bacterium]|nr:septum formation initiator family protein [Candidatus Yanofskybacteria bacterium]
MHPLVRSKLTTVVLAGLAVWLVVAAVAAGMRRHVAEQELQGLRTRIQDAQRENQRLAGEVERMRQPQWLALLARQRLNYHQPDETVVFVYKSEKSATISPPSTTSSSRSQWRAWWNWLVGDER